MSFPPTALGSPFSLIECSPKQSPYLLVILASGVMKVWDVSSRRLVLSETIEPITRVDHSDSRRLTLLRCHVTVKGQPILTFAKSNPDSKGASSLLSYTFDLSMGCWCVQQLNAHYLMLGADALSFFRRCLLRMRVADDSFVFSDFNSSLPTDAVAIKDIPVRATTRFRCGFASQQRFLLTQYACHRASL